MRAARIYEGGEIVVEDVPIPSIGSGEVLVEVRAAAVLPNMAVLLSKTSPFPLHRPPPPYTLGSGGATGIIRSVGEGVKAFGLGDRVFVIEILSCGECVLCRRGMRNYCDQAGEMGLFAYSAGGLSLLEKYRDGAMAEYVRAPTANLARLPKHVDLDKAVRLGYWSIAFRGVKEAGFAPGGTVAVIGATGSMGIGAVFQVLALGATMVFAIARNRTRLEELCDLDPNRIIPLSIEDGAVVSRIREMTGGYGIDLLIDAQGFVEPTTTQDVLRAMARRGKVVLVGGVQGDISLRYDWFEWNGTTILGSLNYLISDVEELAQMMAVGLFPSERLKVRTFGLNGVSVALEEIKNAPNAFWTYVVHPWASSGSEMGY